jgi:hypothetical protein
MLKNKFMPIPDSRICPVSALHIVCLCQKQGSIQLDASDIYFSKLLQTVVYTVAPYIIQ